MKKLLMFGLVLLGSLALVGCEFLPDDVVDQVSEELCREEPENPLCDVENVGGLEEEAVTELFNQVKAQYMNGDLGEYCDTFFSEKNIDLLDRCRSEADMLFPSGIEDFELETFTETEEHYVVTFVNSENNARYEFYILLDGDNVSYLRISGWSYEEVEASLISVTEVREEIGLFLENFTNPDVSNEELCRIWYDGIDDDCDDDGLDDLLVSRSKFKAGAELSKTVNIVDPDSDGDGYSDVEVVYDFRGHVTVLKLRVNASNNQGQTQVKIMSSELEHSLKEEALNLVHAFLADYTNPDISVDEVCAKWVGEDLDCNDTNLRENKVKFKAGADLSGKVSILDPDLDGDGWMDVAVAYDFRGHVTVLKLTIQVSGEDTLSVMVRDSSVHTVLEEETASLFDEFLADLKNEETMISEVCRVWYDGIDDDCDGVLTEARSKFKAGAELSKTVNVVDSDSDGDGLFDGTLEFSLDGHVTVLKYAFREVISDGMRSIVFTSFQLLDGGGDCDDTSCEVLPGEVESLYKDYLEAYNNIETTKEEINTFFTEPMSDAFYAERERLLGEGGKLVFVDVVGPIDFNTYIVVYDVLTPRGNSREDERLTVRHSVDKASPYIVMAIDDDDDGDGVPTAEEDAILEDFKGVLNGEDLTLDERCMEFFGVENPTCPIIEEEYSVHDIEKIETSAGILIRIRKRPDLLTEEWQELIEEYRIYFYYNDQDQVTFELVPTAYFIYTEEITREFQTFLDTVLVEEASTDEVCHLLAPDMQVVCADMRNDLLGLNPSIVSTKEVYIDGVQHIEVTLEYTVEEEVRRLRYHVSFARTRETLEQYLLVEAVE